jgi:hypothetical protein
MATYLGSKYQEYDMGNKIIDGGAATLKGLSEAGKFIYKLSKPVVKYASIRAIRGVGYLCKQAEFQLSENDSDDVYKEKDKNNKNNKNKKNKKNQDENQKESEKEKERRERKIKDEIEHQNQSRDNKIVNLNKKISKESGELLREVPNSKYNTDKLLQEKYFNFAEYVIKYRSMDNTPYFDVFASYIEIMKEKFEQKAEINELMINEIKKRFEGLININKTGEDNEEEGNDEEDQKEEKEDQKEEKEDKKEE